MPSQVSPSRLLRVRNPRTGEEDYQFYSPDAGEIANDIEHMRRAQPGWEALGAKGRSSVLEEWQARLKEGRDDIIKALAADTGRTALAHSEYQGLMGGIDAWRALAESLLQNENRPSQSVPGIEMQNRYSAYPVAGVISPWNFPLLLSFIDTTPALMAGSAVYVKPSEVTPRFAEPLSTTIDKVDILRDVLKIAAGDGESGSALISNVDVVAFTGSVATGRKVGEAAARAFIPAYLELGGKDPAIVTASADVEQAASALLRGSIVATGQACQSIERIYVDRNIYDTFVETMVRKAESVGLSFPNPHKGVVGPLIFERQADTISVHLEDARAKGATILTGGDILNHDGGLWIRPTVVTNVTHQMKLMTEETFGPIMPIMAFDSIDEAINLANDTVYGLSAAVFAEEASEAMSIGEHINAGAVSINDAGLTTVVYEMGHSAFGLSGIGPSRFGPSGLLRYVRTKALLINTQQPMPIDVMAESAV